MKHLHQIIFLLYLTRFSKAKSNLYSPNHFLNECTINTIIFTQFLMAKSKLYKISLPKHILDECTINTIIFNLIFKDKE